VTELPLDVHLMIENADNYIGEFISAGADIITVHFEACKHLNRTIQLIKEQNIKAGVVLNPATPLSSLEEMLHEIDMVLLMSVNPGFGGQKFIPSILDKIQNLSEVMSHYENPIELQVDGGINSENVGDVKQAGASVLVAGSAIFNSKDYKKAIKSLREG
jgi:ribulose-phosphate 3-epimerase